MSALDDYAIKTYRYLRLAMVTLIFLLAVSLAVEWWETGRSCFQTSISAYYYTPVQAILVGVLISIGVCMIALKGNTGREDILLNVGGMLAPAVALVPTPGAGDCRSVAASVQDTSANIANNMTALFVTGAIGLLLAIGLLVKDRHRDRLSWWGAGVTFVVLVGGFIWFVSYRAGFTEGAHYTAALALFACIIGVVGSNALRSRSDSRDPRKAKAFTIRYAAIAVGMLVSLLGMGLWKWLVGWDHAVLWIEGTLIVLFAAFWIIQTFEMWDEGVRGEAGEKSMRVPLGT
jgi:dipeptide/tripeptide permease